MAKSTRSKVKRSFRAKKRTEGVYAATEAARLARLHAKLKVLTAQDKDGDVPIEEESGPTAEGADADIEDAMDLDNGSSPSTSTQKISTHGPRGSRREQWRLSKGLPVRSKSTSINRQGIVAAKRKAGRSHRRR
ncbi:hypothetical protein OBBRIDRAFT_723036 [Obba rivulosa]|uniref:DUF2423 domain-containing protein n=1 Tax=Obba rivulosa TaxID=1052685 RepID=A0A8E2DR56_9APHY|nr:hypothetical protein OBBRIDRAFT_723036 [Obba rivulosa]